jgi:hypothetical protein
LGGYYSVKLTCGSARGTLAKGVGLDVLLRELVWRNEGGTAGTECGFGVEGRLVPGGAEAPRQAEGLPHV